jgi:hypothetical protein
MKWIFLILALSCTTAPPVKKLVLKDIKSKDCLKPLEDVKLNTIKTFAGLLQQTAGTAGTVVATSAGVVGDTVVVGTGLAGTFYLCARDSLFCEDIIGGYVGIMEEADMLWSTKKAYNTSTKWRCPQVDHISHAFRKVSSCLYVKGEYVAAFEQLALIEENMVMSDCMSDLEKEKIQELKAKLTYNVK